MFTAEYFIDSVQNAKKQAVNTFVVNEQIKNSLVELIDVQTSYAKAVAKNSIAFAELFVKNFAVGSAK